jgi:hypothetical protein
MASLIFRLESCDYGICGAWWAVAKLRLPCKTTRLFLTEAAIVDVQAWPAGDTRSHTIPERAKDFGRDLDFY